MKVQSESTVMTIANAIALSSEIIKEVAGTEVADTLNGNTVSRAAMDDIIASNINRNFSNYTNQVKGQV